MTSETPVHDLQTALVAARLYAVEQLAAKGGTFSPRGSREARDSPVRPVSGERGDRRTPRQVRLGARSARGIATSSFLTGSPSVRQICRPLPKTQVASLAAGAVGSQKTTARQTNPAPWDRDDTPEGQPLGSRPMRRRRLLDCRREAASMSSACQGVVRSSGSGGMAPKVSWGTSLAQLPGLVALCQPTERNQPKVS